MNKKLFAKKNIILTVLLAVLTIISINGCAANRKISRSFFALDTFIEITIYDSEDEKILDEAEKIVKGYEYLNSDISDEPEYVELTKRALEYCRLTDGAFDITIRPAKELWDFNSKDGVLPDREKMEKALKLVDYQSIIINEGKIEFKKEGMAIDLGAIAKGYIADQVKIYLENAGIRKAIINLGGNVLCLGGEFKIGIKKPETDGSIAQIVKIKDQSAVTSGTYERYTTVDGIRYHHILDSKTGYPIDTDVKSASVICDSSEQADALSTICLILGEEKARKLINDKFPSTEVIFLYE